MKKIEKLQAENSQMDQEIDKLLNEEESRRMVNLVVALRGANVTLLEQELARRDLLEMVYSGKLRGESLSDIIGDDDPAFAEELIEALPQRSAAETVLDRISVISISLGVLMMIKTAMSLAENLRRPLGQWFTTISIGDLLMAVFIIVAAYGVVNMIIKETFDDSKETERKQKVFFFGIFVGVVLFAITSALIPPLRAELFYLHPAWLFGIGLALFMISRFTER